MRAVIYARTSSSGAVENRQSTDSQVAVLLDYAKAKNIEVIKVFEEHISGAKKNKDRAVLNECIEFVKQNNIDVILCESVDRIGRSVFNVFETISTLADNKINAYFLTDDKYILDEKGEVTDYMTMVIFLKSFVGKIERNNIANRLSRGRKYAIENNLCTLGRPKNTKMSKEDKENKYSNVIKLLRKGLTVKQIHTICNAEGNKIGEATIWRIKKEFCPKND